MRRSACVAALSFLATVGLSEAAAGGVDTQDTKLLTQPAVSADHLAFIYADDLWVADLDGKNARRLTADPGPEANPAFSPDGKLIAFTGHYEGNADVYLVPVTGGTPKRLTYHPGADLVRGFTPDGKAVLFASQRNVFTRRYHQFFAVPLEGGMPTQLPIPYGYKASYSPDGQRIAYTPVREVFEQWKNYRGGTHSRIWLFNVANHATEEIPQPKGRCNDTDPYWIDAKTVLFRSDRNGEFNLFAYDSATKAVQPLTKFEDFPVLSVAANAGKIVFEQAGYLHQLKLPNGDGSTEAHTTRLKIGVAADLVETRPRFVKGSEYIRHAAVSPSGARAVFEVRGEIVTVPAEKGDPRNLTQTPGANERTPAWSPDARTIAFFSDASGEYELHLKPQDGKGKDRVIKLQGSGFYTDLVWSHDSKKLLYRDNAESLFWVDVPSGKITRIAETRYGAGRSLQPQAWSHDSQWVAYTLEDAAHIQTAYVYSVTQNKSHQVTDGLSEVTEPVFDASGKYLYFFGSTDTGMSKHGFAQSSQEARPPRRSIYLAVLRKDLPSPFARESDEEKIEAEKAGRGDRDPQKDKDPAIDGIQAPSQERGPQGGRGGMQQAMTRVVRALKAAEPVRIDFDGLSQRIVAFPLPAGNYVNLQTGTAGQVYYLAGSDSGEGRGRGGPGMGRPSAQLHVYDLEKRKDDVRLPAVMTYQLTPDGRKLLYAISPRDWYIGNAAGSGMGGMGAGLTALLGSGRSRGGPSRGEGGESSGGSPAASGGDKHLNLDAIEIRIDPPTEWREIFAEAWRINRDFFYAPNMHGADWRAMRAKYEPFLEHAATRNDVNRIIQWMCSELAVGHHRGGGGDRIYSPKTIPGGLLGADYEVANGRYRFKKVYGGLNWSPELRAPLTAPGVNVKAGEYLLAVQGKELQPPTEIYQLFENTANKSIEITVGPSPDGKGSRTVTVEPIAEETDLRNRAWVESNLQKVTKATGGRVAYVYVPDTATMGLLYFKRYFFPQVDKDAIIVDERFNSGGQIADYYIDILRRPFTSYWAPRYGADWITPSAAIFGPKVMLIDENAGSGGDMLPWMFRKYGLGKIIGKRTWGGLVGVSQYPVLMDGGQITAPSFAIWTETGWVVENEGVPPDIEVEQTPAQVIAGHDPQLEKAIEVVLAELKAHPPKKPERPPYPIRARQPAGKAAVQAN